MDLGSVGRVRFMFRGPLVSGPYGIAPFRDKPYVSMDLGSGASAIGITAPDPRSIVGVLASD